MYPDSDLRPLLKARYGQPSAFPLPDPTNGVLQSLLEHRSVRAFRPDPLPPGTLETLVAAAQSAPSSSNLQVWSLVAVQDPARKARLAEYCGNQAHVAACPLFLAWLADLSRLERVARRLDQPSAALDTLEMGLVGVIDAALAAQNAVVAAESLGLGTVYIGGLRNRVPEVARELELPAHVFPVFGLCVGYPDPAKLPRVKPRLPQSTVLHRERYRVEEAGEAEAIAAYDGTMSAFYRAAGIRAEGWTPHSANRVKGPESLSGRDKLADFFAGQGFPLK